jgi:threonine dehydratase
MTAKGPTIDAVRALRQALGESIWTTPLLRCAGIELALDNGTRVWGKLEFLQRTGTFKARGALANLRSLSREQLDKGVTAVSAGNHAIAAAFAAQTLGSTAKVVMIGTANPYRIEACKSYGAEVVLVDDVHEAFDVARSIEREEGRFFVHPFEGPEVATGTGTVGLEICEQLDDFDALIVPIGGGGLMGGIANAVKQLRPSVEIIGVEPGGANSMRLSFDTICHAIFVRAVPRQRGSAGGSRRPGAAEIDGIPVPAHEIRGGTGLRGINSYPDGASARGACG